MRLKHPTAPGAVLSLADYTETGLIQPELRERSPEGAIKELTQLLHQQGWVSEILPFYHAALTREYLSSTATELGLAFPHARAHGLAKLRFAVGRCSEPFAWGVPRNGRVQFVFLVAAPISEPCGYLALLSGLAKLGRDERLVGALRAARSAADILAALQKVSLQIAAPAPMAMR